jgi:anti-sigma-K factor RskA
MERNDLHNLTAAYALDALDERDEHEYEAHLRSCDSCRLQLVDLTEAASALAYAIEAPAPPTDLRDRILERAREERSNVVPLRPRRGVTYAVGAVAAVAASVAIGIGIWASSVSDDLDSERALTELLLDPDNRVVDVSGVSGRLVVEESGDATIVISDLDEAPEGRAYELWVIEDEAPRPAGLFRSEGDTDIVQLEEPVPAGATVAMTVEPESGSPQPTTDIIATART